MSSEDRDERETVERHDRTVAAVAELKVTAAKAAQCMRDIRRARDVRLSNPEEARVLVEEALAFFDELTVPELDLTDGMVNECLRRLREHVSRWTVRRIKLVTFLARLRGEKVSVGGKRSEGVEEEVDSFDFMHAPDSVRTELVGLDGLLDDMHNLHAQQFGDQRTMPAMLLYGPPGTGKTRSGVALAAMSKRPYNIVTAASIMRRYVGETPQLVRQMFVAANDERGILIIDEIDKLLTGESATREQVVQELQRGLDALDQGGDGIFIATTNYPQLLPDAVLRRFGMLRAVPLPNSKARVAVMRKYLSDAGVDVFRDADDKELGALTEGYSPAAIRQCIKNCTTRPIGRRAVLARAPGGKWQQRAAGAGDEEDTFESIVERGEAYEYRKPTAAEVRAEMGEQARVSAEMAAELRAFAQKYHAKSTRE